MAFHALQTWQIQKYQKAVEDHRRRLSRQQGRTVGWHEAEMDFCESGCFGRAAKWRIEYCGSICSARGACLLAAAFMPSADEKEVLSRAG